MSGPTGPTGEELLDVERLARALEAVARHDGPVRDVSFAEFARIVAAEYRRLADEALT